MDDQVVKQEIINVTNQLVSKYKPFKVVLFGSAARGEFGKDSDLDFLVIKDDTERHLVIEQKLHKIIDYSIACDFIFLRPIEVEEKLASGDLFIRDILARGKVLYG